MIFGTKYHLNPTAVCIASGITTKTEHGCQTHTSFKTRKGNG